VPLYYSDASALVKLVLDEPESEPLRTFLGNSDVISCELVLAEVPRAIQRAAAREPALRPDVLLPRAAEVLDAVALLPLDRTLLLAAGGLPEPSLRSLDAIHVAAALEARPIEAFIGYDERQAAAARLAGLRTVAPRAAAGPVFGYQAAIVERFPTVVGGVVLAGGVLNGPSPAPLVDACQAEQAAVLARIGSDALAELPSLAAWRRVFRSFGVDPTAYRSAAEALLRRLTKQGSIPTISSLVDIGNLVSIRHALPVAVFDRRAVAGALTVRFADGSESFRDLGSGSTETPEAGEVVFVDGAGTVHARRWCWRQSAESASSAVTTDVLMTVEGHHEGAGHDVAAAVADLEALLRQHLDPASVASGIVDATTPSFS
jgi:DNA/RNA-binding domain of Phe-tRNA-synthetase-like protein/predicted nucleic acid-binding protein